MDTTPSSAAISAVAAYLEGIASGVASSAQNEAAERLYSLVRDRIVHTSLGTDLMDQLQHSPHNEAVQQLAALELARATQDDASFEAALRHAVEQLPDGSAAPEGRRRIDVRAFGRSRLVRNVIAGGNVDQSRRTRLTVGGLVGTLVLASLGYGSYLIIDRPDAGPGRSAVNANLGAGNGGAVPGVTPGVDISRVGLDPGERGVRETFMTFVHAYANGDGLTVCRLIDAHQMLPFTLSQCTSLFSQMAQQMSPEVRQSIANVKITAVSIDEFQNAEVEYTPQIDALTEPFDFRGSSFLLHRPAGRWVIALQQ